MIPVFVERLRSLVKRKCGGGLELARHLGVSSQMVSKYVSGKSDPSLENAVKIAEYYDVSLDWLLGITAKNTEAQLLEQTKRREEELVRAIEFTLTVLKGVVE